MRPRTFEDDWQDDWQAVRPTIAGYLFARIGDHRIVDELEQEIAVAAWEGRHRRDTGRSFAAWAMGIAKHKVADHFRRQGQASDGWQLLPDEALAELETLALEQTARQRRRARALRQCLAALPRAQRELIEAYYVQNQQTARLARRLALTVSNVKVRLHRIRQALRRCIERHSDEDRGSA